MNAIALLYNKYDWKIPEEDIKDANCTAIWNGKTLMYWIYITKKGEIPYEKYSIQIPALLLFNLLAQAILDGQKEVDDHSERFRKAIITYFPSL